MHMKSVCIVALSSEAYLYGISFAFGVKLMSNCFFTFLCFYLSRSLMAGFLFVTVYFCKGRHTCI